MAAHFFERDTPFLCFLSRLWFLIPFCFQWVDDMRQFALDHIVGSLIRTSQKIQLWFVFFLPQKILKNAVWCNSNEHTCIPTKHPISFWFFPFTKKIDVAKKSKNTVWCNSNEHTWSGLLWQRKNLPCRTRCLLRRMYHRLRNQWCRESRLQQVCKSITVYHSITK